MISGIYYDCLPVRFRQELDSFYSSESTVIEEIRLRLYCFPTVKISGGREINISKSTVSEDDIDFTVSGLCRGSMHCYTDSMSNGFIPIEGGGRCGLSGAFSNGKIGKIYSLNIRIPHPVRGIGREICEYIQSRDYNCGLLICSPPGCGKTTLLRDVASCLSGEKHRKRISVIDSRSEIWIDSVFRGCLAGRYDGIEKSAGIEMAIRTMSPDFVICDETTDIEAASIEKAFYSGVNVIATSHSQDNRMPQGGMLRLCKNGIFSAIVGITKSNNKFIYNITETKGDY